MTGPNGDMRERPLRFFLAGIMQGSHVGDQLHDQEYRAAIRQLLARHFPQAEIYDPLADHANSLAYDDERGRTVFFHHNELCRSVDVVLAFVPEASMGTAIEMWEAHRHARAVIAISPLVRNWAVKFLSHEIYADVSELAAALDTGRLQSRLAEILRR